ncbi:MAG TPA: hypothetical protein LFW21_01700 [Rickettsia endosymbiont of Pyrocoelia pectoralis]|nr:hypothetical protein [Rickettsia endosymbiont of Pyrocoelia pectoralis]
MHIDSTIQNQVDSLLATLKTGALDPNIVISALTGILTKAPSLEEKEMIITKIVEAKITDLENKVKDAQDEAAKNAEALTTADSDLKEIQAELATVKAEAAKNAEALELANKALEEAKSALTISQDETDQNAEALTNSITEASFDKDTSSPSIVLETADIKQDVPLSGDVTN